jgi:hypothetical protein
MAITGPTVIRQFYDFDNTNPYNTNDATNSGGAGTDSLVAGRLYLVHISSFSSGAAELPSSVVFDPGGADELSFTNSGIGTGLTGFGVTGNTHAVWWAFATATTSASFFRVTFGGTQSAAIISVTEWQGVAQTGTIVQAVLNNGTGTTPDPGTMSAFGATDNATLLFLCRDDISATFTPTEGRSEAYDYSDTERNSQALHYQNPHGSDTTLNATITSDDWSAIGVELKAAAAAVANEYTAPILTAVRRAAFH